jgi:serine/threonine protein kinase
MAPEVRNRQPYGLKADIWSLGVIYFHMVFGKCPFK